LNLQNLQQLFISKIVCPPADDDAVCLVEYALEVYICTIKNLQDLFVLDPPADDDAVCLVQYALAVLI
jgi:hypothetical protein